MSWAAEQRQYDQDIEANLITENLGVTGYSENFIMGVGQTVDRALTVSESYVRESGGWEYSPRDEELKALRASGEISDDEWLSFTRPVGRSRTRQTNYSELAQFANSKLGTEIQTNAEIDADMREGLKQRRAMAEDVFARQTGTGFAGEILGGITGYALEPANAVAMVAEPIMLARSAYLASMASTRLGRALVMAKTSAQVGVGTEMVIQPFVFNWHEEIGMDMGWEDALMNIAAVGLFSGVIGGAAGVLSKPVQGISATEMAGLFTQVRKVAKKVVDEEAHGILEQAEAGLKGAEKQTTAKEHFENIDSAEKKFEEKTVDGPTADEMEFKFEDMAIDDDFDVLTSEGSFKDFGIDDMGEEFALMNSGIDSNAIDDITYTANRIKEMKECGI